MNRNSLLKSFYGLLFVVVLPAALFFWARTIDPLVGLAIPISTTVGMWVALFGGVIMLTGMGTLTVVGKGLPMNAFPPPHYVHEGIYRLLPHPIYVGFCVACFGVAALLRSPAGFWLVTPVVVLGCTALVWGYERPDLLRRFGSLVRKPLIALPTDDTSSPSPVDRIAVYLLVLLPWVVLYEAVAFIGVTSDAINGYLPFERLWPVWEWTEIFYASTYLVVVLVPLVGVSSRDLREFALSGLTSTLIIMLFFLAVPVIAPPRDFTPQGPLGSLLMWERALDTPAAAFPSFHVVWAFLSARIFARALPRLKFFFWIYAFLISASCVTTGMHSVNDVLAGLLILPLVMRPERTWEWIRSRAESIANSWNEWRLGPLRIINHGFYGGTGTFLGAGIVAILLGPASINHVLIVGFAALITAGLWAQFIEGSPSLLRPYGFYGGVVGVFLGCFVVYLLGGSVWLLLGAYAVAAPVIQGMGRLRCLVQGCCHGREAHASIGIRYRHPRSRVCRLAHLTDVPIHPTPVYSILWNIATVIILARLWSLHVSIPLIAGLYLILNGLGRFVEEAYRGEPQTPIVAGLRLYQWTAITSIVVGAGLTMFHSAAAIPSPQFSWDAVVGAACIALVTTFAVGVDFPESNKRFSRLA